MSRKNIYLTFINSKLNGDDIQFPLNLTPKNRAEEYLYGISQLLLNGVYDLPVDLKPKTKEELFLEWLYNQCKLLDGTTSNKKKLELIDKVTVKIKPLLKVGNLSEYYIFTKKDNNFNVLLCTEDIRIKKKGLLRLRDISEKVNLVQQTSRTELECSINTGINVQKPISVGPTMEYSMVCNKPVLPDCISTENITVLFI